MDKSLAKKLLKYVLSEESVLDIESILVAGLIYYSAETEFDLPQKFTHRAIQLINAKAGFQIGGRTLSISSYIFISEPDLKRIKLKSYLSRVSSKLFVRKKLKLNVS